MTHSLAMYNVKIQTFLGTYIYYVIMHSNGISINSTHAIYFIYHENNVWQHEVIEPDNEFLVHKLREYVSEEYNTTPWAKYALWDLAKAVLTNKHKYYNTYDTNFEFVTIESDKIDNRYKGYIHDYLRDKINLNPMALERFKRIYDVF